MGVGDFRWANCSSSFNVKNKNICIVKGDFHHSMYDLSTHNLFFLSKTPCSLKHLPTSGSWVALGWAAHVTTINCPSIYLISPPSIVVLSVLPVPTINCPTLCCLSPPNTSLGTTCPHFSTASLCTACPHHSTASLCTSCPHLQLLLCALPVPTINSFFLYCLPPSSTAPSVLHSLTINCGVPHYPSLVHEDCKCLHVVYKAPSPTFF